ncbi:MAG: YHS domain-containing protein [Acidobacteria bacterium]|nr:YHS domain-containing protein [Acidobacteriota bacterium]
MKLFGISIVSGAVAAGLLLAAPADEKKAEAKAEAKAEGKAKDPVCGMEIDAKSAAAKTSYKGTTYYFCSKDEKSQFDKSPEKYVAKK